MAGDDWIDEVYYNGVDIRRYVENRQQDAPMLKKLRFKPVEGAVLAIAAHDNQPGTSASFGFACESSRDGSPWNFELSPGAARFARAFSTKGPDDHHGPMKRPADKDPPMGWYENNFDESAWVVPGDSTHKHWQTHHKLPGVWVSSDKYTFYRIKIFSDAPSQPPCVLL